MAETSRYHVNINENHYRLKDKGRSHYYTINQTKNIKLWLSLPFLKCFFIHLFKKVSLFIYKCMGHTCSRIHTCMHRSQRCPLQKPHTDTGSSSPVQRQRRKSQLWSSHRRSPNLGTFCNCINRNITRHQRLWIIYTKNLKIRKNCYNGQPKQRTETYPPQPLPHLQPDPQPQFPPQQDIFSQERPKK